MRIDSQRKLFFGMKIDSKLREALAQATPGDRHYFDDPNSEFLRVLPFGEDRWIGKVVDGGVVPSEVEDIQRNVISILNRIAPGARHSPSALRIYALDETPGVIPSSTPQGGPSSPNSPDDPLGRGGPMGSGGRYGSEY